MKAVRTILNVSKSGACLFTNMDKVEDGSYFYCDNGRATLILKVYV